MKPVSRNLLLELAAIGLFLLSLVLVLLGLSSPAVYVGTILLDGKPPTTEDGLSLGVEEALAASVVFLIPSIGVIAMAWGMRSLMVNEGSSTHEQD